VQRARPSRRAFAVQEPSHEHSRPRQRQFPDPSTRPAAAGDPALVECADAATGEPRYVICAVDRDDGDYVLTPFGHLAPGNPYDAYVPPTEAAGPPIGSG
jgi:hypothetical protein